MATLYLYIQLPGSLEVVTLGRLRVQERVGEFVYSPAYVKAGGWVPDPVRYALRPQPYTHITRNRGVPGFIRDAAPDGWGERLLERDKGAPLDAVGYLLHSPNHDRAGNLMTGTGRTPPAGVGQAGLATLTQLDAFIEFADGVQSGFPRDTGGFTRAALQQRSSLGGARPKCTLQHEGRLILAKPRDRHDVYDIPAIEHACMTFAAAKGLTTAGVRLHRGRVSTLFVERFDREPAEGGRFYRTPMLSGLTLLDSDWYETRDRAREWHYGHLVDEMARWGVPVEDRQELFKRICFNILVGNDDDHPKNVAVLYKGGNWRLSPLYDVVPSTQGEPPQRLAMAIGRYGHELSRRNLLSQVEHYGLREDQAEAVIDEVVGWATDLEAHYHAYLQEPERSVLLAAMGTDRLRS